MRTYGKYLEDPKRNAKRKPDGGAMSPPKQPFISSPYYGSDKQSDRETRESREESRHDRPNFVEPPIPWPMPGKEPPYLV
jgi:hypothetical protein